MQIELEQTSVAVIDGRRFAVSSAALSWLRWLRDDSAARVLDADRVSAAARVLVGEGSENDLSTLKAWLVDARERDWQIARRPNAELRYEEWHAACIEWALCQFALGWTLDQVFEYREIEWSKGGGSGQ